jgi:hypothetical protein
LKFSWKYSLLSFNVEKVMVSRKRREPTSMIICLGLYEFVGILTLDVAHCRGCDTHSH